MLQHAPCSTELGAQTSESELYFKPIRVQASLVYRTVTLGRGCLCYLFVGARHQALRHSKSSADDLRQSEPATCRKGTESASESPLARNGKNTYFYLLVQTAVAMAFSHHGYHQAPMHLAGITGEAVSPHPLHHTITHDGMAQLLLLSSHAQATKAFIQQLQ